MSTDTKDGGAAFPRTVERWNGSFEAAAEGMSLRDFFAAHALAGIIAATAHPSAPGIPAESRASDEAYIYADAMLRRRSE